jgi:hypothetical protein
LSVECRITGIFLPGFREPFRFIFLILDTREKKIERREESKRKNGFLSINVHNFSWSCNLAEVREEGFAQARQQ